MPKLAYRMSQDGYMKCLTKTSRIKIENRKRVHLFNYITFLYVLTHGYRSFFRKRSKESTTKKK